MSLNDYAVLLKKELISFYKGKQITPDFTFVKNLILPGRILNLFYCDALTKN